MDMTPNNEPTLLKGSDHPEFLKLKGSLDSSKEELVKLHDVEAPQRPPA